MNDNCGDSLEENHKRVETAVDRGGSKVIGKMAKAKNKSTNVKDNLVKVNNRMNIMKIKSAKVLEKSVKAMKKSAIKKTKNPNLVETSKLNQNDTHGKLEDMPER